MGSASRPKPIRLAQKMLRIRAELGLSQNEMLARLGETDELFRSSISAYERGVREPPLPIILKYARIAGIYVEALIDDELDLPEKLPASPKSELEGDLKRAEVIEETTISLISKINSP